MTRKESRQQVKSLLLSTINLYNHKLYCYTLVDTGPIGQVYDGKVIFFNQPVQKKNVNPHFDISRLDSLPKIEIVYMYVDASAIAINAFINDKTEGLIIAGVVADSHYPQKARILLMLALTITIDQNIIQGMFLNF